MSELRIVAGQWRGRRIQVPDGGVRPTADRVREAWMSIVQPAVPDAYVADLCAGTGALGLEALSRGAAHCDFVEKDARIRRALEENVATLGAGARASIHRGGALAAIEKLASSPAPDGSPHWGVAFADPPYNHGVAITLAERWLAAPFAAIFGVEHEASITLPPYASGQPADRRSYGITALTFYHSPEP